MARRSLSGARRVSAEPAPASARRAVVASAGAERARMGAATAVTAEADRNVRRVERLDPRTSLFSIGRINDSFQQESSHSDWCYGPALCQAPDIGDLNMQLAVMSPPAAPRSAAVDPAGQGRGRGDRDHRGTAGGHALVPGLDGRAQRLSPVVLSAGQRRAASVMLALAPATGLACMLNCRRDGLAASLL
jgi:hypothetical protein